MMQRSGSLYTAEVDSRDSYSSSVSDLSCRVPDIALHSDPRLHHGFHRFAIEL